MSDRRRGGVASRAKSNDKPLCFRHLIAAVTPPALLDAAGLGYAAEAARCAAFGVTSPRAWTRPALAAAITKACGGLAIANVRALTGHGFDAATACCGAFGVPRIGSIADVVTCLSREHAGRTSQLGEAEIPRLRALLDAGGAPLE